MSRSLAKRRVLAAMALVTSICIWLAVSSSLFPVFSDDHAQSLQVIESDNPMVIQTGQWTSQAAAGASGGGYLYNAPANPDRDDPALTLQFSGSYLEVMYVSGPNLGTLAIEVDGTVLRTVITANDRTLYNQRTTINYLTDEVHTLRVYAQSGGVVGVDAFITLPSMESGSIPVVDNEGGIMSGICNHNNIIDFVTRDSSGTVSGNNPSYNTDITLDGRYVVFSSDASNLVAGDTNNLNDIFLYDRLLCETARLSIGFDGSQANSYSYDPTISGDGRYVAFASMASNLVPGDTNATQDNFLLDRQTGQTIRFSLSPTGEQSTGTSGAPMISTDGRYISFYSIARNLIPNDTTVESDIYLYDRINGTITVESLRSTGIQATGGAINSDISADGRYIVFTANASNYITGGGFETTVVRRDRQTGEITIVSINNQGQAANNYSEKPRLSADGQVVVFASSATNLVPSDTNARRDIFVRDIPSQQTTRISVSSDGTQGTGGSDSGLKLPNISADGRWIIFSSEFTNLVPSDTNVANDMFLYDRQTGETRRISVTQSGYQSNNQSGNINTVPAISSDGQIIIFASFATNLVPGTYGTFNLYSYNRGIMFPPLNLSVIAQGRNAIQLTWSDNNVDETEYRIERSPDGITSWVEIATIPTSAGSSYIYTNEGLLPSTGYSYRVRVYRNSDSNFSDYSQVRGTTTYPACAPNAVVQRVIMDSNGMSVSAYAAEMTGDGRYIVFSTPTRIPPEDTNGYFDTFVHDRLTCTTTLVSRTTDGLSGNYDSLNASIAADGRWIVFASEATNLVSNTIARVYQIYLYDLQTGQMALISHSPVGAPGDAASSHPEISRDGRFIVFESNATNLAANDAVPAVSDVYVYDRLTDQTTRASVDSNGNAGNGNSRYPTISDDGQLVAFDSTATNLVPNDTNAHRDIFVRDRQTGQTSLISTRIDGTPTLLDSQEAMISGNGRYVVFNAYDTLSSNPLEPGGQIYLRDLQTGLLELISRAPDGSFANWYSEYPVITPDGRYIFFVTGATNLGDDGPDHSNVYDNYVYDRQTHSNFNANRDYQGNISNIGSGAAKGAISDDGSITLWYAYNVLPNSSWSYFIFNRNYLPSPTPTDTPTSTVTATDTTTSTPSSTPTTTPTATASGTPSGSPSNTPSVTPSVTSTLTSTSTSTDTPSSTPSTTPSNTSTNTPTLTPSATASGTPSSTSTSTITPSATNTPSITPSATLTASYTPSKTATRTPSPTWTPSPTSTATHMTPAQNYDSLALFDSQNPALYLVDTLDSQPATSHIHPVVLPNTSGMVGVMGDWNGDGQKTPGYYLTGVFYITNTLNPTSTADWVATWFGLFNRPAIAGRFAGSTHDCIGVVDSGNFPPYGIAFTLYYTCDLNGGNPAKSFQWLSIILPDAQGYSGMHQFEAGDFDSDGFDSVAIRRGAFIAFTNVTPGVGHAAFNLAQYWGTPEASSDGDFVAGDWDGDGKDSFGVYHANTHVFYRRNDLQWNSGIYDSQNLPTLNATSVTVSSWRVR